MGIRGIGRHSDIGLVRLEVQRGPWVAREGYPIPALERTIGSKVNRSIFLLRDGQWDVVRRCKYGVSVLLGEF